MRLKEIAKLLIPGVVLLVAGAAAGQDLVTGEFEATDSRNTSVETYSQVLLGGSFNWVEVEGECTASTGERVHFEFQTNRIDKSNVTDKRANLDQKHKSNPAWAWGTIPGICQGDVLFNGEQCFEDSECGGGTCDDPAPVTSMLDCDKIRVSTRITPGRTTNFRADASQCTTVSAPLVAAVEVACTGRDNRGVTVKASGTAELKKVKISGRGDTVKIP